MHPAKWSGYSCAPPWRQRVTETCLPFPPPPDAGSEPKSTQTAEWPPDRRWPRRFLGFACVGDRGTGAKARPCRAAGGVLAARHCQHGVQWRAARTLGHEGARTVARTTGVASGRDRRDCGWRATGARTGGSASGAGSAGTARGTSTGSAGDCPAGTTATGAAGTTHADATRNTGAGATGRCSATAPGSTAQSSASSKTGHAGAAAPRIPRANEFLAWCAGCGGARTTQTLIGHGAARSRRCLAVLHGDGCRGRTRLA